MATTSEQNIKTYFLAYHYQSIDYFSGLPFSEFLEHRTPKKFLGKRILEQAKKGEISEKETRKIFSANLAADCEKDTLEELAKLQKIYSAEPVKWIRLEMAYYKPRLDPLTPRGTYRNGHIYREIKKGPTGGNFDKPSTLAARFFNADFNLLRFVVDHIDRKKIKMKRQRTAAGIYDFLHGPLGYGIQYSDGLPCFSHGVGLTSHCTVFERLGFSVDLDDIYNIDHKIATLLKIRRK